MEPACWDAACWRVRHFADDAAIVVAEFARQRRTARPLRFHRDPEV